MILLNSVRHIVVFALLAAVALPVVAKDRLVILGGSVTEIVFALEAGDKVVAADASSLYPAQVQQLPRIGYYRSIPVEGVLSVYPDLVLASENAGPTAALEKIQSMGVEVHRLSDKPSTASLYERIRSVAAVLNREEKGALLIKAIAEALYAEQANTVASRRAVVLLNRTGSFMVAGRDTAANVVLELAGLENAMTDQKGYKPLSLEGLVALAPEVIVLTSATAKAVGGIEQFTANDVLQMVPAVKEGRVGAIDDLLILGVGPRVASAVEQLHDLAQ